LAYAKGENVMRRRRRRRKTASLLLMMMMGEDENRVGRRTGDAVAAFIDGVILMAIREKYV
jgi:hypothetical protein